MLLIPYLVLLMDHPDIPLPLLLLLPVEDQIFLFLALIVENMVIGNLLV